MADFNSNDAMLDMYLFETAQLLEQLEQIILQSDSDYCYSEETINEIFRIMHTIKGSSAMMMYDEISDLTHTIEDLFFYLRQEKNKHYDCSSLNDIILDTIDFIKAELEKIRNGNPIDGKATELKERIRNYLTRLKNGSDIQAPNIFKAVIYYEDGCEMENVRAFGLIHNLEKMADEIVYYPKDIMDNDSTINIIRNEGFRIYLKTYKSHDEIYDFLMQTIFLKDLELTEIDNETYEKVAACGGDVSYQANAQTMNNKESDDDLIGGDNSGSLTNEISGDNPNCHENKPDNVNNRDIIGRDNGSDNNNISNEKDLHNNICNQKEPDRQKDEKTGDSPAILATQNIISVSVAKLDKLMDLVGEMVIAEAMVLQNPDLEGLELPNFQKASRQLSKITSEIQDMVMAVRMVPLSATFHRMNRIVRDMSRKLNKEVALEIIGEETEVDKNIIEHITDPLMHLVRNAVDHGIESVEERQLLGKPIKGKVTLEAKSISSDVHIIVKDDGKGLDKDKILKKAKEKNLLTVNEQNLSDSDIYKLILLPGFSTKDDITEYSGRGVGMDVVAKNIEAIGGSILIESEKNKGTQITLKIPLTLAIIDGMNLQVGNSTYTIPTISIKESFKAKEKDIIVDPDGNEMILVRGQCYPIVRLHKLFNIKTDITELTDGIIIMVTQDDKYLCIFADKLLGQQQVVVKSLPEYIKKFMRLKGISGCTLLGDGSISLILDIAGLVSSNK